MNKKMTELAKVLFTFVIILAIGFFLGTAINDARAAANANVPNFSTFRLVNDPFSNYSSAFYSGTTFSGESSISIVVNEDGDGILGGWDMIVWDFETATVGTWAGGGVYNYRDLVYDVATTPDTFYGTLTNSDFNTCVVIICKCSIEL